MEAIMQNYERLIYNYLPKLMRSQQSWGMR